MEGKVTIRRVVPFSLLLRVPLLELIDEPQDVIPLLFKDCEDRDDHRARDDSRNPPNPGLFQIDGGVPDVGEEGDKQERGTQIEERTDPERDPSEDPGQRDARQDQW